MIVSEVGDEARIWEPTRHAASQRADKVNDNLRSKNPTLTPAVAATFSSHPLTANLILPLPSRGSLGLARVAARPAGALGQKLPVENVFLVSAAPGGPVLFFVYLLRPVLCRSACFKRDNTPRVSKIRLR